MKYKSAAISLTYIKNGESSIISKILTKEMGLQTFFVKGVRSKNSKKKLSLFEPLKLLHIDASFDKKNPFNIYLTLILHLTLIIKATKCITISFHFLLQR